jgi:hypothetical protein
MCASVRSLKGCKFLFTCSVLVKEWKYQDSASALCHVKFLDQAASSLEENSFQSECPVLDIHCAYEQHIAVWIKV